MGAQIPYSISHGYVAKTATYTAADDYVINCTSGSFTVNLPSAVGITGRIYIIKNSGAGAITIDPAGSETIDDALTEIVDSGAAVTVMSTGAKWVII